MDKVQVLSLAIQCIEVLQVENNFEKIMNSRNGAAKSNETR